MKQKRFICCQTVTSMLMSEKLYKFNIPEAPVECFVLVIDLEGSTNFFSHFGAHQHIHKYLNHFIQALNGIFGVEHEFWTDEEEQYEQIPQPDYWKFLGDGFLFIWKRDGIEDLEILSLLNRLRTWRRNFSKFNAIVRKDNVPVPSDVMPSNIRVGISSGLLRRIKYHGVEKYEWVGKDINLATRLQSFCKELGIIAHGLNIDNETLKIWGWTHVTASNIRGIGNVGVAVDPVEFKRLPKKIRDSLFRDAD